MSDAFVEVSRDLTFPASEVYEVIADYQNHHPRILPMQYFKDLKVTAGGQGSGTQVKVQMKVMGVAREFQMVIAEPEPGRLLTETDAQAGTYTSFKIEPRGDRSTRVTIASRFKTASGPAGWMEKLVTQTVTRRIYQQELLLLESYLKDRS